MNDDSMKEAFKRRKLNALDITILLGDNLATQNPDGLAMDENEMADDEDEENSRELDLAPKGTDVGALTDKENMADSHGDAPQDKMMIQDELEKLGVGRNTLLNRKKPLNRSDI